MTTIRKLFMIVAGLIPALSTQAQVNVSGSTNDVGEIPVQYALSPAGAVTYQVPVDVYPDPEEFQPRLSFGYNSQQGESALGYGWNVGGLSAITHVPGNIHYDGNTTPLSLAEDKLTLDGTRLIKTGTDAWQSEQGFVKVKKLPDGSLEARYPNGNTATFETSTQAPFSYVLTHCRNMRGRTIKYVYTQADNLPYIRKIMYAQSGETYNDSIVFDYRHLTNQLARYADGKPVRYSRLLNSVKSYYRGQLWRNYTLTYEKEEVNQLVRLDCQTESRALNPLRFEYGDKSSIEYFRTNQMLMNFYFTNEDQLEKGYSCLSVSRGRLKQNSQSDGLVSYPQISTYRVVGYNSDGHAKFGSYYNEDQELLVYKELSDVKVTPVEFRAGAGFQLLAPADINGTGVDVLVKVNYNLQEVSFPLAHKSKERLVVSVYNTSIDPNNHVDYTYESNNYVYDGSLLSPRQRQFLLGDFNGDGKTELLAISSCRNHVNRNSKIASHALMVDLQNRQTIFDGNCFDYTYFQANSGNKAPDRLIPMDYNGDGKTDICLINFDGTYVYEFTGSGFKQLAYLSSGNGGVRSSDFDSGDRELMVADMNGDGNMDLVLAPRYSRFGTMFKHLNDGGICNGVCKNENYLMGTSAAGYKIYIDPVTNKHCDIDPSITLEVVTEDKGKNWWFILSTGNSAYSSDSPGFTAHTEELFRGFHETTGLNFMLVDVDSDGLPDLLKNERGTINLYLNKNGKISTSHNPYATQKLENLNAQFVTANVAQSYYWSGGLICLDNAYIRIYDYTRKENMERMIRNVTNSHGVKNNHAYVDIMTTAKSRYESGNGSFGLPYLSYPYTVMTPHCYVNVWTKKQNGNDVLSWEYYKYINAVFHRKGLGFRGFQQIETEDVINERKIVSTLDPTLLGAEVKRETPTETIVRQYTLDVNPNKTSQLKLQKETREDILNKTETTATYEYNSYGQPTRSTLSRGLLNSEETRNSYLNIENATTYLLGLPSSSVIDKTYKDSISMRASAIEYNQHYLPSRKTASVNGKTVAEEQFIYNATLRLERHKQRAYESTDWLENTYTYDTQGRISRETDAMGRYTDYTYDTKTGLLLSATNNQGRTIRNEYDEWGNVQAIFYPDGRVKRSATTWSNESAPGLYVTTTTETGKPVTKTYYDLLNREVRSSQMRFDGKEMKSDKQYNAKTGLLERSSQPTTGTQPSRWNLYAYDKYGRLTSTRYASGKVDSCAYGALTDIIIQNGIRHIRTYDEAGMMVQATDPAGSIQYYYRPDGSPLVVVAPGGVQTRFYYDDYNRRIAIKDPSAGIRRTVYDAAGNVRKETDADGREILSTYDRYGRITKQTTPDMVTDYTYDNTENQLQSAISTNGTSIRYTYDTHGRLKTLREEAPDSKWLLKEYAYTTDGLPASISYTSKEGVLATENLTYTNGYLTQVSLSDGTLIYQHNEENALGQLTKLTAGTMNRSYAFSEWGLPTRRTVSRTNGTVLSNHSYGFNVENSNLENRKDETRALNETFGYDGLNRLSTYAGLNVVYDNNGNILSKNDAGTLAYTNPNRPYAVTGLEPTADKQIPTGLDITYTAAQRPSVITQGTKRAELTYNAHHDRVRTRLSDAGSAPLTRYYMGGNYEQDINGTSVSERLYLGGSYYSAPAVLIKQSGQTKVYYIHRDYLGSILQIADAQGNIVEENSYDAWGNRRNPATQVIHAIGTAPKLMLGRGFTGHEHLDMFGLINMNARLYDPVLGRFLSPDPYVQMLDFTQSFNRYSYALNNPFAYIDPSGEIAWFVPVIIGAVIGAYSGGVIANEGQYNPAKWNYNSGKTWGYMLGGAVVGGVSGYAGWGIAGSGIPMANTAAIASSSLINSVGTWAYTGGQTPISISVGVASYDFTNGNFGYLGEKGNEWYENAGYGLGALANASDILMGLRPKGIDLVTEHSDGVGHSALVKEGTATGEPEMMDPNALISVGPDSGKSPTNNTWHWKKGTNSWNSHSRAGEPIWRQNLKVNMSTVEKYSNWLNTKAAAGKLIYSVELSSCVTHTSAALNFSGIFNIGIHPYLLNAQMYLWSNGIRPWTFSYFFNR